MGRLFDHDGLVISEDWIRTPAARYPITDVRDAWVTRRQVSRGSRWFTAGLGAGAVLVLIGVAGLTGWLTRNWLWLLAAPVIFLAAGTIGLLDPVAIYLEKRHHELWITTSAGSLLLWKANAVEVGKALRQIQRARELGDLRENAEYKAAKDRQDIVNARIAMLKRRAGEIALMNLDRIPRDRAGFGSTVELRASTGENVVYQLVMSEEADVEKGLISTSSPIGRAILNKEEGDEIKVTTPGGPRSFELVKLTTIHDE